MRDQELLDDLTRAFIRYQHNIDNPMNPKSEAELTLLYRTDAMFHGRVVSLVAGVFNIVKKYLPKEQP